MFGQRQAGGRRSSRLNLPPHSPSFTHLFIHCLFLPVHQPYPNLSLYPSPSTLSLTPMTPAAPTLTPPTSRPAPPCSSCSVLRLYRLQACRTKRPNGGSALMCGRWGEGRRGSAFKHPFSVFLLLLCPPLTPAGLHLVPLSPLFHWRVRAMKNQQRSHQTPPPKPTALSLYKAHRRLQQLPMCEGI